MSRVYLFLIAGFLVSFISCEPAEINYYEFNPHDLSDGVYEGYAENKNKAWVELHIEDQLCPKHFFLMPEGHLLFLISQKSKQKTIVAAYNLLKILSFADRKELAKAQTAFLFNRCTQRFF